MLSAIARRSRSPASGRRHQLSTAGRVIRRSALLPPLSQQILRNLGRREDPRDRRRSKPSTLESESPECPLEAGKRGERRAAIGHIFALCRVPACLESQTPEAAFGRFVRSILSKKSRATDPGF
jgi:hypothetical protein